VVCVWEEVVGFVRDGVTDYVWPAPGGGRNRGGRCFPTLVFLGVGLVVALGNADMPFV
jgi:hypothetical protein